MQYFIYFMQNTYKTKSKQKEPLSYLFAFRR